LGRPNGLRNSKKKKEDNSKSNAHKKKKKMNSTGEGMAQSFRKRTKGKKKIRFSRSI